jgi:DNA-directed RNA polymerase subunit K/omega
MEDRTLQTDSRDGPLIPTEPAPPIASRFLFVDVAALRAKQLRKGARVRLGQDVPLAHKAERVAMEEVRRGLVYYHMVPPKPASAEAEA